MAQDKSFQKQEPLVSDETRHRRKHPQTSKSAKRADHKHEYERIIMQMPYTGWTWSKRCSICGKFAVKYSFYSPDLMRPEHKNRAIVDRDECYTVEELHKLHPNVPIYLLKSEKLEWYPAQE